jgi:hypothetical protein
MEYCFECDEYPCERYKDIGAADSFITYRNVTANLEEAERDLAEYLATLDRKHEYLKLLAGRYNDGRSKSMYCLAVELFPIEEIGKIFEFIENEVDREDTGAKEKAGKVAEKVRERAGELGIELVLRK